MNENGEAVPVDARRLRLTFDAFCQTYGHVWEGFARTQVVDEREAAVVVDGMRAHLKTNWPIALRQQNPAAYAWRLLKEHLAAWRTERPELTSMPEFEAVVQRFRGSTRRPLEKPDERFGLYAAILQLPERQHDVVILKYLLDMDDDIVAEYLGIAPATVRFTLRHARGRVVRALNHPDFPQPCGER